MRCEEVRAAIGAYLDEELSVLEILRVDEHLEHCEACRQVRNSEADLHALLAADAVLDAPPARLRENILASVAPAELALSGDRPGRRAPVLRIVLACATAAVLLLGVLLVAGSRGPAAGPLTADVVVWHLDAERNVVDLELKTSDSSRVTAWLGRRLGLRASFPSVAPGGERLVGARVSSIASHQAAQLLYEGDGPRFSLFLMRWPFRRPQEATEHLVEGTEVYLATLVGVRVAWWSEGWHLYVAAARASDAELLDFAALCVRLARERPVDPGPRQVDEGAFGE